MFEVKMANSEGSREPSDTIHQLIGALVQAIRSPSDPQQQAQGSHNPINSVPNQSQASSISLPNQSQTSSCDRRPLLPSFLQKRRGAAVVRGGRKKPKVSVFDRTIILLPGAKDLEQQVDICIPRGKERETLGHNGMIGKVRLTSDMNEDEIFSEIRTVFSKVMGNDNNFPFTVLQPTGSGCKTLSVPALSASFLWTAREICGSAKTVIYIMAGAALQMHEPEEVCETCHAELCKCEPRSKSPLPIRVDNSDSDSVEYSLPEVQLPFRPQSPGLDPTAGPSSTERQSFATSNTYSAYCNLDVIDLSDLSNDDLTEEESHIMQRTIERSLQRVEAKEDDVDIGVILKEHAQSVLTNSEVQRVNIRRSQLFADTLSACSRSTFDLQKALKVRFIGEAGVDDGGPKREYFRLFYESMGQSPGMFQGYPEGLTPVHNSLALSKSHYTFCGALIVAGLLQGAEAPSCFSTLTAHFLAYGSIHNATTMGNAELLNDIPDHEAQQKLRQVMEAHDQKTLKGITDTVDLSFRFDCGFNAVITLENRQELLHCVWRHFNFYSVYAELVQLRDGMRHTLDFGTVMDAHPQQIYKLLAVGAASLHLTADSLTDLILPEYAIPGSNRRANQETLYYNWCKFLEDAEDAGDFPLTLSEILVFITGSSRVPPMGFSPTPKIAFTSEHCLPHSSTCANRLTIPEYLENYDEFKDTFILSIQGCQGFDQI